MDVICNDVIGILLHCYTVTLVTAVTLVTLLHALHSVTNLKMWNDVFDIVSYEATKKGNFRSP